MKSTMHLTSTAEKAYIPQESKGIEWLHKEQLAWRPQERLSVSEWADTYRVLDPETSPQPGPWRTDKVPYLREPMDKFGDKGTEEIVLVFGSQLGKTEDILNSVGYTVQQDPGPMLLVYPTEAQAEHIADKRLRKMINASPALQERYNDRASKKLELQFAGMYMAFGWANSPAALASKPCRYAVFDEIDKFPSSSGKEADPVSLGEERTKNFWNRKILKASTPTTEYGPIWRAFKACDVRKEYYVPCPHCGHLQVLKMGKKGLPGGVKWPDGADSSVARDTAWYECEACRGIIENRHKRQMLLDGQWKLSEWDSDASAWREVGAPKGKIRSIGYHLSSIYSPWVPFGEVAAKFLETKDFPELLMNFVNSWLGEPWINKGSKLRSDMVKAVRGSHTKGVVPKEAVFLTLGADYQADRSIPFVVRAWGEGLTSWNVDYGILETWADLEKVLETTYQDEDGGEYMIWRGCVDSGNLPDEVYDFCTPYADVIRPCKGASHAMNTLYDPKPIDKDLGRYAVLKLMMVNTIQAKDFIFARLQKPPNTKGAWMVPSDVEDDYCEQICSEAKVPKLTGKGVFSETYEKISSHAANHYLDCEVYAYVAAEWGQVRRIRKEDESQTQSPTIKRVDWLSGSSSPW